MSRGQSRSLAGGIGLLFALAFLLFAADLIVNPVHDPDLWWHLKTGQVIVETGGLLQEDPFAYTSEAFSTTRERAILQGYPVTEILLYGAYRLAGEGGLIGLRLLVAVVLFGGLVWRSRRLGGDPVATAGVLAVSAYVFLTLYNLDRPQVYSFFCFALLMAWFESRGRTGLRWTLLPLMVLWANMHGGFVFGVACLAAYGVGLLLQRAPQRQPWPEGGWVLAGLLASLLNPTGMAPFVGLWRQLLGSGHVRHLDSVTEYESLLALFVRATGWDLLVPAVLIGLVLLLVLEQLGARRLPAPELLVLTLCAVAGLVYVRHSAFLLFGIAPYAARLLTAPARSVVLRRAALVAVVVLALTAKWTVQPAAANPYPEGAVDFVLANDLQGRMFNSYDWGGYLIWRLYPEHQVFIDGRVLDEAVYRDYSVISQGMAFSRNGRPLFRELLDQHAIEFAVMPLQTFTGEAFPLIYQLSQQPDWFPVYLDDLATVFVRRGRNDPVLFRKHIDKKAFVERIYRRFRDNYARQPSSLRATLGFADVLIWFGEYRDAVAVLERGECLAAGNARIASRLSACRDALER